MKLTQERRRRKTMLRMMPHQQLVRKINLLKLLQPKKMNMAKRKAIAMKMVAASNNRTWAPISRSKLIKA